MAYDFQKLRVWQIAIDLLVEIYGATTLFPKGERFGLIDQVRRAANSVAANIAEASGRHFKKDKIRVLYQARGEIEEVRSHLLVAGRLGYENGSQLQILIGKYSELAMQLNAFIKSIQNS